MVKYADGQSVLVADIADSVKSRYSTAVRSPCQATPDTGCAGNSRSSPPGLLPASIGGGPVSSPLVRSCRISTAFFIRPSRVSHSVCSGMDGG